MSGGTKRRRMLPSLSLSHDSGFCDVPPGGETAETGSSCSSLFATGPSSHHSISLMACLHMQAQPDTKFACIRAIALSNEIILMFSCSFCSSHKLTADDEGCEKNVNVYVSKLEEPTESKTKSVPEKIAKASKSLSPIYDDSDSSDVLPKGETIQTARSCSSMSSLSLGSLGPVMAKYATESKTTAVPSRTNPWEAFARKTFAAIGATTKEPMGRCDWPAGASWLYYDIPGYAYKVFSDGVCHMVVTDGYTRPSRTERLVVACKIVTTTDRTEAEVDDLEVILHCCRIICKVPF